MRSVNTRSSELIPTSQNKSTEQTFDFSSLDGLKPYAFSGSWLHWLLASIIAAITGFLWLVIIAWIINFSLGQKEQRRRNLAILRDFATANQLDFTETLPANSPDKPGTIFQVGHSKKTTDIFSGELKGFPFVLSTYAYETGSGRSRRRYDALVMEITFPRALPHMVIDSLVESGNGKASTLPIQFHKSQKLELEGDFYKYFTLYAPDKYAISALSVIAPDAMEVLMRHAALCDIEIIDNKMYFYWPEVAKDRQGYENAFETTQEVLAKVGKKLVRGDIFSDISQSRVHSQASVSGVRLQDSRAFWQTGIVILIILFFGLKIFVQPNDSRLSYLLDVVMIVLFFGSMAWGLWRQERRLRLRDELEVRVNRDLVPKK